MRLGTLMFASLALMGSIVASDLNILTQASLFLVGVGLFIKGALTSRF